MNPEKFKDGGVLADDNFKEVNAEDFKRAYYQWAEVLNFLFNVESGLITISVSEYQLLPTPVHVAWNTLKAERAKLKNKS